MNETGFNPPAPPRVLAELTDRLLAAETVDGVAGRVSVTARHVVPGADLASVTLREDGGQPWTPVEAEPEARELDRLQYRSGGPCVDASDPDGPAYALSTDLAHESAWPVFAAAASAHGVTAALSTALPPGPEPARLAGALNIYSRRGDGLDAKDRHLALLLATHASLAMAAAEARRTAAQLRKAIDTRTVIGQATGIVMARRRLDADAAFEMLRRTSQNRNIKVNRLAELLMSEPDLADRL